MKTFRDDGARGFGLLEVIIATSLIAFAAMAGVAYVTRGTQHADWVTDRVFARQKAMSILSELRAYVEGGAGEVAADLDGFDDGLSTQPALTITADPSDPGSFVDPEDPVSGNVEDQGVWRWSRRITVRRFPGVDTRDLRICTVRVFRVRPSDEEPGEEMAQVSTVIRTVGDAYPTTQVYDVYLLALENVPGWWVYMDAIQPFLEATLTDLQSRNPGLTLRAHWITKMGYGRDEEYAPYTNEARISTDDTAWAYAYPGRLPVGEAAQRYYVPQRFGARLNVDGAITPSFTGDRSATNPLPYALADMHNHAMRHPEEEARFASRVAAGLEDDAEPSWRLLLDRMVLEPERYHNAILINLHGELLPMPPTRNYADPAKIPELRGGWRVVAHPERLRPARVAGNDAASNAPRWRVYAYKTDFANTETIATQREPFLDLDRDGAYGAGETFEDWNGNGVWDAGIPACVLVKDGDFSGAVNAAANPSLLVRRLPGGLDADADGAVEDYTGWSAAPLYPEAYGDANGDGIRQVAETFLDLDGDGTRDEDEPWQEVDGDGAFTATTEGLTDANGNGVFDAARAEEAFTDANGNGRWDAAEPYWDADGDGAWTGPTLPPSPWRPWAPVDYGNATATAAYLAAFGEPFLDVDGDRVRDDAEVFFDADQDGVRDGGTRRGEMWCEVRYDAGAGGTVVLLHGTPLVAPSTASGRGLPVAHRLYDLEYVPCTTPDTAAATNRFARDLSTAGSFPKNTARWQVELPLPAVRRAYASAPGLLDGDAADRTIVLETRWGTDLATGTLWPVRREPANVSRSYAWFHASPATVPFSERYQFQGDPRHSPYLDTDATGTTARHGYNWDFDNLQTNGDARASWLGLDPVRLRNRWEGRVALDVGRYASWLRTALTKAEAVYTTLTGFSYYYLSVGGDVGYDAANGFPNSIPMSGRPFGISGTVNENSIIALGTTAISGSLKHVVSNDGGNTGIRSGGRWWSKPWIGEIWPDAAYAGQWRPWGNLRAATGTSPLEYHLVKRGAVPSAQQPAGTRLSDAIARLAQEGSTSIFHVGTSTSTFHHQFADGRTGRLVDDGPELAQNYNFPIPTTAAISRPFGLATSGSGGVGDEYPYTAEYPRFSAQLVRRFYDHQDGQTGSALVRLREPGGLRGGYVVVNGIDRTLESGSAFIARYSVVSLVHAYFAAGVPGGANRVKQLPRIEVLAPTLVTELENPASIEVAWGTQWLRWDGLPYTRSHPADFAESESDLVYVPIYSRDGGRTWRHMRDDSAARPGVMPWVAGVGPDPARTLRDLAAGATERFAWATPAARFPEGTYLIRVEAYRASESLHYAQHTEKIYVER